jgi:hypothetical protein
VKSGVANATKLKALLKKTGAHEPVPPAGNSDAAYDDPVSVLIFSFLLWESTTSQARDAMQKLVDSTVDFNELRVCMPSEIVATIGARYPKNIERAQRLKSTLHSIYLQRHSVSLEHLAELGKRETKAFVEGLKGIPPFVSSRLLQRCYDVHTIPVDDRLVDLLVDHGVLSEPVEADIVGGWISRQVKSKDGSAVEATLRVLIDTSPKPQRKAPKKTVPKKSAAKKTAAKAPEAKKPAKKVAKKAPKKSSAKKSARKKTSAKTSAKKRSANKATAKKKPSPKKASKAAKKKKKVRRR